MMIKGAPVLRSTVGLLPPSLPARRCLSSSSSKYATSPASSSTSKPAVEAAAPEPAAASKPNSSTEPGSSSTPTRASQRNPFYPYKNPNTGRWIPALPLRRQAQLAKAAQRAGMLDQLPPGPKVDQLRSRIQRNALDQDREGRLAVFKASNGGQHMWTALIDEVRAGAKQEQAGDDSASASSGWDHYPTRMRLLNEADKKAATSLAREQFVKRGPYSGRNPRTMFKGHKPERDYERKMKNRQERMAVMDETVKEWRTAKAESKKKLQPTLPF